jgi:hypothetical protein
MIVGLLANFSNEIRCALNISSVIGDCLVTFPHSESWTSPRRQLKKKIYKNTWNEKCTR